MIHDRVLLRTVLAVALISGSAGTAGAPESSGKKYNRLRHEKSPYLLQHADNPIWWHPWGQEAMAVAKRENKPIFLSVGYSSCYWCHFMEKDSFEKQDVADVLNEHFISVKVDREERPDVDRIYMTALVSITGGGGWPMSMFLTPDGRPFYGASTVPHENFISLLKQIASFWKTDEAKIRKNGGQIAEALARQLDVSSQKGGVDESVFRHFFDEMQSQFDESYAGFGGGNKFPRPHVLSALLRIYRRTARPMSETSALGATQVLARPASETLAPGVVTEALDMPVRTLKAMARGGIHDQLSGGFHRYSVDRFWDIPHFEKMLYDNAGLASSYIEAYQVTRNSEFARVAARTLNWVLAEMTDPVGGFYSAQDAGDFGEEGDFYAWTEEELSKVLSDEEFKWIRKIFQISKYGNFENNRNVFHIPEDMPLPAGVGVADTWSAPGADPAAIDTLYASAHAKLLAVRAGRSRPRLDDKILTDWNGLTIAAMSRGYQVLGEPKYLQAAQKAAGFIWKELRDADGNLLHRWRGGHAAKRALLDDYAFLIHGLIELYQSDFDPKWFEWAVQLQSLQDGMFWDEKAGAYFFDDARDSTLILRAKEFEDMAVPSGNSISALNLLRLADLTYDVSYRRRADRVIRASAGLMSQSPSACPQMLIAADYAFDRSKEIAIVGKPNDSKTGEMLNVLRAAFLPNKVVASSDGKTSSPKLVLPAGKSPIKGTPTAYVCEKGACQLPTTDPSELLKQASTFRPLTW